MPNVTRKYEIHLHVRVMTAPLSFLPLTFETIGALSALKTAPHKSHLIAPVGPWMGQAILHEPAVTFGVFRDGIAVGLVSLTDPRAARMKAKASAPQSSTLPNPTPP